MSAGVYGITTFCDDIRYELFDKMTLVGCYSGEIVLHDTGKINLPAFAALVNVVVPKERYFESFRLRIIRERGGEEEAIFDVSVSVDVSNVSIANDDTNISINVPCKLANLEIQNGDRLRARMQIDQDEEVKVGGLKVTTSRETSYVQG